MAALPVSLDELREWLKIPHRDDDPAIHSAMRAAVDEWTLSTGRAVDDWSEVEWMAVRQRVAGLVAFRGDDEAAPSTVFIDTIRRLVNPKAVG